MTELLPTIKVVLVEDSSLVRQGIKSVLAHYKVSPAIEVVGEASTAADALRRVMEVRPNVVLLDIRLPDDAGINVCREILKHVPETRVVMLTSHMDDTYIYD